MSSGHRKIYRLSRRGNRRLNHAIHMAAVTQISHRHSDGRAYYERKAGRGQDPQRGAARLKRRVSDAIFARLQVCCPPAAARLTPKEPGRATGNDSIASAAYHTPTTGSSAKPLRARHHLTTRSPTLDPEGAS